MIFGRLQIIGAATVVSVAVVTASYWAGKSVGKEQAAVDALEATVKDFTKRGKINGQVSTADAAGLCNDLGLQTGDRDECMRRVREAAAKP